MTSKQPSKPKTATHPLVILAYVCGYASLVLFVVFLYIGAFSPIDLKLNTAGDLLLDAALSLAFFMQHSTMTRTVFRRWLTTRLPPAFHGTVYTITSGIVLIIVLFFWQPSSQVLIAFWGPLRWGMRGLFFLALLGFFWGVRSLRHFDALGVHQALRHVNCRPSRPPAPFSIRGPYGWVRHPFYLLTMVMIWACPDLTADRLLFNLLWTLWIIIGGILEERDLVALFGKEYVRYREKVPMFFPCRLRPYRGS